MLTVISAGGGAISLGLVGEPPGAVVAGILALARGAVGRPETRS